MEEETKTLRNRNITLTLYSRKELKLQWCERKTNEEWGGGIQTVVLTYNFSCPYNAVLSSPGDTQPEACCELLWETCATEGNLATCWCSPWQTEADTDRLTVSHEGICIYLFTTLTISVKLLIYTSASCAEKSLIDGLLYGQYTTNPHRLTIILMLNIYNCILFFKISYL